MAKKRMSNGAFLGIWCTAVVLAMGIGITVEVLGNNPGFKTMLDTYVNKGEAHVVEVPGSESWDTNFYSQKYPKAETAGGNAEAKADGEDVVEEICDEGMVLLKNEATTLPLANKISHY